MFYMYGQQNIIHWQSIGSISVWFAYPKNVIVANSFKGIPTRLSSISRQAFVSLGNYATQVCFAFVM